LPLGVVEIGHALRNEISPRQGPIRLREFTIADIEFFFDPEEPDCPLLREVENDALHLIPRASKEQGSVDAITVTVKEALRKGYIETQWQAYFMTLAKRFLAKLGIPDDRQRFVEKLEWERAHYSAQGYDQEIMLDRWEWTEVSGHNYRTDYDLTQHMKHSKVDMRVYKEHPAPRESTIVTIQPVLSKIGPAFRDNASQVLTLLQEATPLDVEESFNREGYYAAGKFKILPEHIRIVRANAERIGRRFIPHVVEPSFGIDRLTYAVLEYAYSEREDRTLLQLPRELAPVQVSVYPLISKSGLAEKAKQLLRTLLDEGFDAEYDEAGSIGRRYARADEAGTPLCLTVDHRTLNDNTVTIRDRDSWKQVRAEDESLPENLRAYFSYKKSFEELGEPSSGEPT
jgi:glycyl-tRNA synthetase